jgi:eukaryotic-like serine/threonine-protein kinase
MEAERWVRIDRLLDQAMERPREMRSDFLTVACEGDDDLRREVESLLKTPWASESFLSTPALEIAARRLAREREESLVGKSLGAYQVISVLGVGGMGEVYLAQDERLNRKLALKLLPQHFTQDAKRLSWFEPESRTASALNHPNIITIYDIGQIEDQHFIAAEYIEGRTLRELLADGPLEGKEVIEIGLQIASALAVTHEAGIIHRDLKPENVMQRKDGYIKVLDFGLARVTERQAGTDDLSRTGDGLVFGTISYMSPEQALGEEMDCRSDLFSLGILMFELVTGTQPFTGNTPISIANNIIHHPPPPLERLQPDLPRGLRQIITRLLEKDRRLRYQTADELRRDLKVMQLAMESGDVAAAKVSASAASPVRMRNRILLATGVVVILIGAVVDGWRFFKASNLPAATTWNHARFTSVTDMLGREAGACISPDGEWIVYGRSVNAQWDLFRQRIGDSNPINLTNHPASDGDAAISPEGERIAFHSQRDGGGIFTMGAKGEEPTKVVF